MALAVLVPVAILLMLPIFWILSTALKSPQQLADPDVALWPSPAHWGNFLSATTFIDFWPYVGNSLLLSSVFGILTTISSAMTGYGFARLQGRGKSALFAVLIAMMMMPAIVTLVPTYLLFSRIGLVGTYWPWVMWGIAGAPYLIFLYRQFFAGLPKELEEAAILDGCNRFRVFWTIFLPLSRPVIITVFVLSFSTVWGDFIGPNLLLNTSNTTLAVALAGGYVDSQGHPLNQLIAAGSILYVIPVVVIFILAQPQYVQGVSGSGIK